MRKNFALKTPKLKDADIQNLIRLYPPSKIQASKGNAI